MEPMFEANAPLSTYEQANLALQQANIATQQAGNDIALWVGVGQAAVALTVGLIQAGVVGWGIRYMIRMGERREQQHADRHEETMRALEQQATASREQATASREQHAETIEALRQQGDALRTLIERTAPSRA